MKKLMLSAVLSVCAVHPSLAKSSDENGVVFAKNVYLVASSFDTFLYVDRSSVVFTSRHTKTFDMTYVQNGYRGLVVSSLSVSADCTTPHRMQLLNETVYKKNLLPPTDPFINDFELQPVAHFTRFPSSEVVKDNSTLDVGRYSFWGQTWITVCQNQWKHKQYLGNATPRLMVFYSRNISKGSIKDTVIQNIKGKQWVYRTTTPPDLINIP